MNTSDLGQNQKRPFAPCRVLQLSRHNASQDHEEEIAPSCSTNVARNNLRFRSSSVESKEVSPRPLNESLRDNWLKRNNIDVSWVEDNKETQKKAESFENLFSVPQQPKFDIERTLKNSQRDSVFYDCTKTNKSPDSDNKNNSEKNAGLQKMVHKNDSPILPMSLDDYQTDSPDFLLVDDIHDFIDRYYLGRKIRKARWKPEGIDGMANYFVSGSWDDERNNLVLWKFKQSPAYEDVEVPNVVTVRRVNGGVNEIRFVDNSHFVYGTSSGDVCLTDIAVKSRKQRFFDVLSWSNLHHKSYGGIASCNTLDVLGSDIATGGEDGRIFLLNADNSSPVTVFGGEQCASVQAIRFIRHNEIISGNLIGQVRTWDTRVKDGKISEFSYNKLKTITVNCITQFPTQKHIVFVGGDDGSITVWDMRNPSSPKSIYQAHEGPVTEIHFNYNRPGNMFSCSSMGDVWQWYQMDERLNPQQYEVKTAFPGLNLCNSYKKLYEPPRVKELLSVSMANFSTNSVDTNQNRLLATSDNESIVIVRPLLLK